MKTTHEWKSNGLQIYKCIHCGCLKKLEYEYGKFKPRTTYEYNKEIFYVAPKCVARYTEKEKLKYFSKNPKTTQLELFTIERKEYQNNIFIDKPF